MSKSVWTKRNLALIGSMSDAELARKLGISREAVRRQRAKLGVAAGPKGHWPRGQRRNEVDEADLAATLSALRTLLDTRHTRDEISRRALAEYLGVQDSTVRRWLSGQNVPTPARLKRIKAWVNRFRLDC